MEQENLHPKRLKYKDVAGAGKQIYADLPSKHNMVEFTTKEGYQPVVEMVAYAPWIQFEPKSWNDMMDRLYKEMVDAWNEKYGET